MTTWVPITRDDLETWMDGLPLDGKWRFQTGRAGVYLLPLSDKVAVKLSSTIGSSDDAMGRGEASMNLALVSIVTGQVLNKKAMGQSRFHRTTNWRRTWRDGFDRMADAYLKSQGFYDAIASIGDRDKWKRDTLADIEAVPNWQEKSVLHDFHRRVTEGGVLTILQQALLKKLLDDSRRSLNPPSPPGADAELPELLDRLRALWKKAKDSGDAWLMQFAANIGNIVKAGRPLSPRQKEIMEKNFARHRV